jgi:hypothetical protein
MPVKQIVALQKIDPVTHWRDEQRLKELALRRLGKQELDPFRHMAMFYNAQMRRFVRFFENPDADANVKARALAEGTKAAVEYSKLFRLYDPTAGEKRLGGDTTVNTTRHNTIITSASPLELLELIQQQKQAFDQRMAAMELI